MCSVHLAGWAPAGAEGPGALCGSGHTIAKVACAKTGSLKGANLGSASFWAHGPHNSTEALSHALMTASRACVLWRKVAYQAVDGGCAPCGGPAVAPRCAACYRGFRGHVRAPGFRFVPASACLCSPREPAAFAWDRCTVLSCLAGQHIGVIGDSLARQLFQRFVDVARLGLQAATERPVLDGMYGCGMKGELLGIFWATEDKDCLGFHCGHAPKARMSVRMTHISEKGPSAHDVRWLRGVVKKHRFTAVVVYNGAWYTAERYAKPYLKSLKQMADNSSLEVQVPYFSVGYHWRYKPFLRPLNEALEQRARRLRNNYFVDVAKLDRISSDAQNNSWINAEDRTHWMCSVMYPNNCSGPNKLKGFRRVLGGYHCGDPVNLAIVEAVLSQLCSARSGGLTAR